jgi:two-component system sensor histidine kinase DesK
VFVAVGFASLYVYLTWTPRDNDRHSLRKKILLLGTMCVLAMGCTLLWGSDWLELFFFIGCGSGLLLPSAIAAWAVLATAATAIAVGFVAEASWMNIVITVMVVFGLGFSMIGAVRMGATIQELRAARIQIARLSASEAIAEERLRFARDLHDSAGRTLSLIALKSELANRLLPLDPQRAGAEMKDVESLARRALKEARQAVMNYRQPVLAEELDNAREMLRAADIECNINVSVTQLPPQVDAVLAWTVREAITNVIRHSRATCCTITIQSDGGSVRAEVHNDGCGVADSTTKFSHTTEIGSGLAGIAERVRKLQGKLEAGPDGKEHFLLRVTLPAEKVGDGG